MNIINHYTIEVMCEKISVILGINLSYKFEIIHLDKTLYVNLNCFDKPQILILDLLWRLNDIQYCFERNKKTFVSFRFLKTFSQKDFLSFYNIENNTSKNRVDMLGFKTYLMINKDGHVKIGKSKNPKQRESTLQSEQPSINLFAVSNSNIESILHKKHRNARLRGEWFDLTPNEILDIINEYNFIKI